MLHKHSAVLLLLSHPSTHSNHNRRRKYLAGLTFSFLLSLLLSCTLRAQERPYFVTYSHEMEEPGNLEITNFNIAGAPAQANPFLSSTLELEYGTQGWWTTEFYLSGQATQSQSAVFNGFRVENRFRLLLQEHWINPVLYVEFEDVNAADKSLLEVVGHDGIDDFRALNSVAAQEKQRELELKLILSRNWRGWNFSQNTIFEKNLSNHPWEFGYALAASRPLGLAARETPCLFCRENFAAGLEMYGGLGDRYTSGLHNTSQYISPTVSWTVPNGPTFLFGPAFGLNDNSAGSLFRFAISYEVPQVFSHLRSTHSTHPKGTRQ
jgi:hypothetical protein